MKKIKLESYRKKPVAYSFSKNDVAIFKQISKILDLPVSRCLIFVAKEYLREWKAVNKKA